MQFKSILHKYEKSIDLVPDTTHHLLVRSHERVELYLYSPYGPYGLYNSALYLFTTYMYHLLTGQHLRFSAFFPHSELLCLIWFSQQTTIISLNST